jgi:hypothetical protein
MTSVMSSVMTSVMSSVMTSVDTRRLFAVKGAGNHQLINSGKYVFLLNIYLGTCLSLHRAEYTDKKKKILVLIYEEIQNGSGAKSYVRKAFQIYEEKRKY